MKTVSRFCKSIVNDNTEADLNSQVITVGINELFQQYFRAVNKRLDEWVGEDRMNLESLEPPKKEVKTPQKDGKMLNGSRPSSPERELLVSIWKREFDERAL